MWLERVIDETGFLISLIIGGVLAPIIIFLFGDNALTFTLVTAFLFTILADWVSGVSASRKDEIYGSAYGIDGIFRTIFLFITMAVADSLDQIFNSPGVIFGVFTLGILYHVLQSATANAIRTGWGTHVPEWLLNWLIARVQSEIDHKNRRAKARKEEQERGD